MQKLPMINIGLGCPNFTFAVYIANKPPMFEYNELNKVQPLIPDEIQSIGQACGNGWRKVFNVYAKLLFALDNTYFPYSLQAQRWQEYRDHYLLQSKTNTALLFTAPHLDANSNVIHIICGKSHAKYLLTTGALSAQLLWLDHDFAIDKVNNVIVCPYFDYRQLSNIKIERLAILINELKNSATI